MTVFHKSKTTISASLAHAYEDVIANTTDEAGGIWSSDDDVNDSCLVFADTVFFADDDDDDDDDNNPDNGCLVFGGPVFFADDDDDDEDDDDGFISQYISKSNSKRTLVIREISVGFTVIVLG